MVDHEPPKKHPPPPLCDTPGVPLDGWTHVGMKDMTLASARCVMCGEATLRYLHVLTHPEFPHRVQVGRACALSMTDDPAAVCRREREMVDAEGRRERLDVLRSRAFDRWTQEGAWKKSRKGNFFREIAGMLVVIFGDKDDPGLWKFVVGGTFGKETFDDPWDAIEAAFEATYPLERLVRDVEENGYLTIRLEGWGGSVLDLDEEGDDLAGEIDFADLLGGRCRDVARLLRPKPRYDFSARPEAEEIDFENLLGAPPKEG